MSTTAAAVHKGLSTLSTLLSIKIINYFLFEILSWAKILPSIAVAAIAIQKLLGIFFEPVYYLAIYPLETVGKYAHPTFSDFMSVILFGLVGTTYSQSNPFCQWMFFYLPALFATLQFAQFA